MIRGMFQHTTVYSQLVITLALTFAMIFLSSALAMLIAIPMFHLDISNLSAIFENLNDPQNVSILKFFQIIQSLFGFVLAALLLALLFSENSNQYLSLENKPTILSAIISVLLIISIFPFINALGALNSQIHFPEFLNGFENYLTSQDKQNERLMEAFLGDTNFRGLFVNIVMIAIIPAIGEELLFRGVLQNIFRKMTKNYHWGIWISAILFSLIHMQFSGFLPRAILGATFGYMLVWSGSIWVPILAHFVNNLSAVILYYLVNTNTISKDVPEYGVSVEALPAVLLSMAISGFFIWYFYKRSVLSAQIDNNLKKEQEEE